MKKAVWLIVAAAALLGLAGAARAGELDVDIGFFYDQLAPYGEWQTIDPYGPVWCPYDVGPGWRPYWDGDWAYSDWGWTFVSPVDWGWAAYHYGRWGFRNDCGWFWVPGNVWGPSWVAWRYGNGIIGWAPLPPEVGWNFGVGLEWGGIDVDFGIGYSYWSFCDVRRFTDRHVRRYIFDPSRNVTLLRSTRNETHYSYVNNRIVDDNIDIARLERDSGRRITRYAIREQAGTERTHRARIQGGELRMFRPRVTGESSRMAGNLPPARRFGGTEQDLMARHRKEQAQLSRQQEAERSVMARRHRKEAQAAGSSNSETKARHQQESQALAEHHQTQRQVMENRHRREAQSGRSNQENRGGGNKPRKRD
jgi:hypothetical protein